MSDTPVGLLEAQITLAFRQACSEQDWAVAELLLQTLEAIAAREGRENGPVAAYSEIVGRFANRGAH